MYEGFKRLLLLILKYAKEERTEAIIIPDNEIFEITRYYPKIRTFLKEFDDFLNHNGIPIYIKKVKGKNAYSFWFDGDEPILVINELLSDFGLEPQP